MVKTRSLCVTRLFLNRAVTDRQTDRIPIANTRSQQYLPVQLSRVKTAEPILTHDGSYDAVPRKEVPFGG